MKCDKCKKKITAEQRFVEVEIWSTSSKLESTWRLHWDCFVEKCKSMSEK